MKLRQKIEREDLLQKSDKELYEFACYAISCLDRYIVTLKNNERVVLEFDNNDSSEKMFDSCRLYAHWTMVKILYKYCHYE